MLNLLAATILTFASILIILNLVGLVFRALGLGAILRRKQLERYVARAQAGDRLLEEGRLEASLAKFQTAFYPHAARSQELANDIRKHHTGLLTRLLTAADHVQPGGVRLMSLARADRLFDERDFLQRRYLRARASGRELQEAKRDLAANTEEVRAALASLAAEITAANATPRTH
jgi:hypothetical protein